MRKKHHRFVVALVAVALSIAAADAKGEPPMDGDAIVSKVVEADPFGLAGASVSARIVVTETSGKTRALAFDAKSRRRAAPLGQSLIVFNAPADVAGMRFLQIQNKESDDERFLYTPELKRTRRVAGTTRGESFMGTDFSYADLDARDLRASKATLRGEETFAKLDCWRVDVVPRASDAVYGKIELLVRKDGFVPLRWVMFDHAGKPQKTLTTRELRKTGGRWFVTSSRMTSTATGRTTDLVLDKFERRDDIPEETFSLRALEKG